MLFFAFLSDNCVAGRLIYINVCRSIVSQANTHKRTHKHMLHMHKNIARRLFFSVFDIRYADLYTRHTTEYRILNENCVMAFYIEKKKKYRTIFSLCLDLLFDLLFLCLLFICSSSFHFALLFDIYMKISFYALNQIYSECALSRLVLNALIES